VKKAFLLLVTVLLSIAILYFSFFLIDKEDLPKKSAKFIEIESMVLPLNIKINEEETISNLKLAVEDTMNNDEFLEDAEADKILEVLKENLPPLEPVAPVMKKEKPPTSIVKKRVPPPKPTVKRVKVVKVKKAFKSKVVTKEPEVKREIVETKKVIMDEKFHRNISLGEQNDTHFLSQAEMENFKNLEVVSTSKVFTLEAEQEIKSPIPFQGVQKEVKFEDLKFVETLGVVSKSVPSIYNDE